MVLGPDQIPQVVEPDEAVRSPELAVLSAMAHGGREDGAKTLESLAEAYGALDPDHRALYHDVVSAVLPQAAQHYLETLLKLKNYEYQSDFARHYFDKGKAEGRARGAAKAILIVLAGRGVPVSPDLRARIVGCGDLAQLEAWAERAGVVSTAAELFG